MKKHKGPYRFSVAQRILGIESALASDRTPPQLKPGLRRYLRALKSSAAGKGFLKSVLG